MRIRPTTLRYYAKWIPSRGRRWVDLLDRAAGFIAAQVARLVPDLEPIWNQKRESGTPGALEVPDDVGGPSRTRTLDPLIKRRRSFVPLIVIKRHKLTTYVASACPQFPEISPRIRRKPSAWRQ